MVADALVIAYTHVGGYVVGGVQADLGEAANQVSVVGYFFSNLAEALTILMFVQLGAGISIVLNGTEQSSYYTFINPIAYVATAVLIIIAIVDFALSVRVRVVEYGLYSDSTIDNLVDMQLRIDLALLLLFFVASVFTLVFGIVVMVQANKAEPRVKNVS